MSTAVLMKDEDVAENAALYDPFLIIRTMGGYVEYTWVMAAHDGLTHGNPSPDCAELP